MERKPYFKGIPQQGDLYLEKIYLDFEGEPVLFLCSDGSLGLYLCLLTEIRKRFRWIISKTSKGILDDLVNYRIPVYDAFKGVPNAVNYIIDMNLNLDVSIRKVSFEEIDDNDLPVKGVLLYKEEGS